MKLSTWLRAAALSQLAMVGLASLGTAASIATLPFPAEAMLPFVGVMLLNVLLIAALWVPVLRSADGVTLAEHGSADAEQAASALWSLGSHFKRIVLLALSVPLVMAVLWAASAIADALGYDVIWLF